MIDKIYFLLWKLNLVEFPVSYKTLYKSTLSQLDIVTEVASRLEAENKALHAEVELLTPCTPKTTVALTKSKRHNKSKNKTNAVNITK